MDWAALREEGFAGFTMSVMPPNVQLPALPQAITLFVQRSVDETISMDELARILETDAGITIALLKHVNSSHLGLRIKAKSVQQALSLLGRRPSRLFVMATGTEATIRARKSKLINQSAFWNASLQKALFAREVALILKTDADVAFAGGLLQDYLLPVLTNDLFDRYLEFVESRDSLPETLSEYEQVEMGWDHGLAGACLAHQWGLPDDLVCCMLYHHGGLKLLSHPSLGRSPVVAVAMSALLPDQLRQHYRGLELLKKLEPMWPDFRLEQLAETVDRQHEAMSPGVRNDFPLARYIKGFETEPAADEGQRKTVKSK